MGIGAKLLGNVYAVGRNVDRFFSVKKRLQRPVISIGNIASGGRAKSPLCVEIARGLKMRAFDPILLTRGYGRSRKEALVVNRLGIHFVKDGSFLPHEKLAPYELLEWMGDEALEFFVKTGFTTVVGPHRFQNAQFWLRQLGGGTSDIVFLLDDGFQHWSLERDFDIVNFTSSDLMDELLPLGRLREKPEAMGRADCVLELEKDIWKESWGPEKEWDLNKSLELTTRAISPEEQGLSCAHHLRLRDHASRATVLKKLKKFRKQHPEITQLVVGYKEAVKLVPWPLLAEYAGDAWHRDDVLEGMEIFVTGMSLCFSDEELFWSRIETLLESRYE